MKNITILILLNLVIISLVFISAGSIFFIEGWIFCINTVIINTLIYFFKREYLDIDIKNKIIRVFLILIALFIITSGLGYRFDFINTFLILNIFFYLLKIIGYMFYIFSFLIFIYAINRDKNLNYKDKILIEDKLHSFIRQPIYLSFCMFFIGSSLFLSSLPSLLVSALIIYYIIRQIELEEEYFLNNLSAYSEYREKVKFKLIPRLY